MRDRRICAVLGLLLAGCGGAQQATPPASMPAAATAVPASAPAGERAGVLGAIANAAAVEEAPAVAPTSTPPDTSIVLRVDGLQQTYEAVVAQLGSLVHLPPAASVRTHIAGFLAMKTGQSLDLGKRAGVLIDLGQGLLFGIPQVVLYLGTTSDAALRADLPVSPDGSFAVPAFFRKYPGALLQAVPGGLVCASSPVYLRQVLPYIEGQLAEPAAEPAVVARIALGALAKQLWPVFMHLGEDRGADEKSAFEFARGYFANVFRFAESVDRLTLTYRPSGTTLRLLVDATPVPGTDFATVLGSHMLALPPSDGAAVPDGPVEASLGLSGDAVDLIHDLFYPPIFGPKTKALADELETLTSGTWQYGYLGQVAAGSEKSAGTLTIMSCTDSGKARELTESLSQASFSAPGLATVENHSSLRRKAAEIEGVWVDRIDYRVAFSGEKTEIVDSASQIKLSEDYPMQGQVSLLASVPGFLVTATAPNEKAARALLSHALEGLAHAPGTTPLLDRPGVKETAALLGDTSHGMMYVDFAGLGKMSEAREKDPHASYTPSGQAGFGLSWTTDAAKLHLTAAVPVVALKHLPLSALPGVRLDAHVDSK